MLEVGSLVDGKYKILSEIGHGGMSVVYMAINEKANKTWAIKEVRRDGVIDFEAVKQGLVVETNMLKKLKHAHLPSIVDVIEDDETFLIVMDYIEGNTLDKTLREYGAQPQEYVVEWAKQLCDVLGYLHSRTPAIIYRDMKPSNVMLKPDGNLVLFDFGIAREYKEKNQGDTTSLGTIGYAAPEQFGGQGQTDCRTDIYGLGATMYHLVTGMTPNPSGSPHYGMRPIREINPALSQGLEEIIIKCTQQQPADRYQSTAELMYALDNYMEPDTVRRKRMKRKMAAFISAAVFSVIFCAGGITLNAVAAQKASESYDSLLEQASKEQDYESKVSLYEEAIAIPDKAGNAEAYKRMISYFCNNDNEFTADEYARLTKCIRNNRQALESSGNYVDVCFEMGKAIWYHYSYNNKSDKITRMITAIDWFDDACKDGYANKNMAEVYGNIGKFYRDISINIEEATDKEKYKELFSNLSSLLDRVGSDKNENEIVRLELYEICRSALQQYATKFRRDGLAYDELEEMYEKIENYVNGMYGELSAEQKESVQDQGKDVELLKSIKSLLPDTLSSIQLAYGTKKGE